MFKSIVLNFIYLPKIVPIVDAMLRPIAPPDSESKLALRAQAHALVPEMVRCEHEMKREKKEREKKEREK